LNSRLNFRIVIFTLQLLVHELIFESTKPAAGYYDKMQKCLISVFGEARRGVSSVSITKKDFFGLAYLYAAVK
jgi:hypothetical protein